GRGDVAAFERLSSLVYEHLRRMARGYMGTERSGHTLQPTALVNEAFLRLVDARDVDWNDRSHFFAVCARIMRRILVDAARSRRAAKRQGAAEHIDLAELPIPAVETNAQICALDDALQSLEQLDPRRAQVIELRFFGGL